MGVLGMGGFFFRAKDPEALTAWYREHLNIGVGCNADGEGDPDDWFWQTQGGPMVFAPFKAQSRPASYAAFSSCVGILNSQSCMAISLRPTGGLAGCEGGGAAIKFGEQNRSHLVRTHGVVAPRTGMPNAGQGHAGIAQPAQVIVLLNCRNLRAAFGALCFPFPEDAHDRTALRAKDSSIARAMSYRSIG